MGLVVLFVILALILGGVGLAVKGLLWLLFVAVGLLIVGAIVGRSTSTR